MKNKNLLFRGAKTKDINYIHEILYKSFRPYQRFYTDQAYSATILSSKELKDRILKKKYVVFITIFNNQLVGTASISIKNKDILYIRSMAVHPDFQRQGIGSYILDNIVKIAVKKGIIKIVLETSKPLKDAYKFYEKHGFKKTGFTRDFYGVEIYEMIKEL